MRDPVKNLVLSFSLEKDDWLLFFVHLRDEVAWSKSKVVNSTGTVIPNTNTVVEHRYLKMR